MNGQELRRNIIRQLVAKKFGEELFLSHVDVHQRATSAEKECFIKWIE